MGPRGPVTFRYLRRVAHGKELSSQPLAEQDDDQLGWDMLRRVCHQLDVDPRDLGIGLNLG